ncbi:MAG: ATP-binding cassette domain-containing protein, partial [Finegoldia magna]|nr:ATP-binding cassette domain-containing protein [Finegoldia magna]
ENKTKLKNYSLGMKQKLGICQAIMENQKLIMLDEPFNALDEETNRIMINLINSLKKEGKTILIISHQLQSLKEISDRVFIIKNQNISDFN